MMNEISRLQIIESPAGEKMAVVPLAEYETLRAVAEDIEDIAHAEETMRRIRAGEEPTLPSEDVRRMIDGEPPLKVWREHFGVSIADLAARSGVAEADIAAIEAGQSCDSISTMTRLAKALSLDLDDLI